MRLHFVVEGQTEETFVRNLLAPELGAMGIYCDAHRVTTGRRRGKVYRGGLVSFAHLRRDLELLDKARRASDSWFTTMVDLYKLPSDFPSIADLAASLTRLRKLSSLNKALDCNMGHPRFIPYVQLHEFEALLFSDPMSFSIAFPAIGPNWVNWKLSAADSKPRSTLMKEKTLHLQSESSEYCRITISLCPDP